MTSPSQIAEIARRLTKAQRAALVHARTRSAMSTVVCADGWPAACEALLRRQLVTAPWYGLTPLGAAVRAHLEASEHE